MTARVGVRVHLIPWSAAADVNDNDRLKLLSHRPRLCITVSVLPKLLSLHCLEVFREDLLY